MLVILHTHTHTHTQIYIYTHIADTTTYGIGLLYHEKMLLLERSFP
jgi:hypothetical protein